MLYFVATPIGNLKDISFRAVEVLGTADCIYAENPRHTLILLNEYGIKKPVLAYEKFSEKQKTGEILSKLSAGRDIAVVSDAGTPLISDPGSVLRDALIEAGLEFTVLGGACAAVSALVLSGLDTGAFLTAGFLPAKNSEREKYIGRFKDLEATLIFYSAVHDLDADLGFLYRHLGARKAAVVREISKKFEQSVRFVLGETPEIPKKGEFVIVVSGAGKEPVPVSDAEVVEKIKALISRGVDKREAVKLIAKECGIKKQDAYKLGTTL